MWVSLVLCWAVGGSPGSSREFLPSLNALLRGNSPLGGNSSMACMALPRAQRRKLFHRQVCWSWTPSPCAWHSERASPDLCSWLCTRIGEKGQRSKSVIHGTALELTCWFCYCEIHVEDLDLLIFGVHLVFLFFGSTGV
jgi:hypothetical protein